MTREDAPSTLAAAPDCHIFARSRKGSKPRTSPFRIALLSVQWRPSHSWASMDPRYTTTHFTGPPDGSSVFCRKTKDPISPPAVRAFSQTTLLPFKPMNWHRPSISDLGPIQNRSSFPKTFGTASIVLAPRDQRCNYQRAKQKASMVMTRSLAIRKRVISAWRQAVQQGILARERSQKKTPPSTRAINPTADQDRFPPSDFALMQALSTHLASLIDERWLSMPHSFNILLTPTVFIFSTGTEA